MVFLFRITYHRCRFLYHWWAFLISNIYHWWYRAPYYHCSVNNPKGAGKNIDNFLSSMYVLIRYVGRALLYVRSYNGRDNVVMIASYNTNSKFYIGSYGSAPYNFILKVMHQFPRLIYSRYFTSQQGQRFSFVQSFVHWFVHLVMTMFHIVTNETLLIIHNINNITSESLLNLATTRMKATIR